MNDEKLAELARIFGDEYARIYDSRESKATSETYARDLAEGNGRIAAHDPVVAAFNAWREDVLSSDREVVAFVRARRALTAHDG